MAFYVEPPEGNISLQKLETFAIRRLSFLIQIYEAADNQTKIKDILSENVNVAGSECLIEGTTKDHVSHFILRLACCEEQIIEAFFLKAESALFQFRFSCMTDCELCRLFRKLDSNLKFVAATNTATSRLSKYLVDGFQVLLVIKEAAGSWARAVQLYLERSRTKFFIIPFQTVFALVAARSVTLHRGSAIVPFCKLKDVSASIFTQTLEKGLKKAKEQRKNIVQDERIRNLFQKILAIFRHRFKCRVGDGHVTPLSHDQLDVESKFFPPCMSQLHTVLREVHRLGHQARIQYTLFLKEAGLPVHEALMFWRNEYSEDAKNKDGCHQNWQQHERRYTYSIRHLYGLEGSHINYRAHCCQSLQNMDTGTKEIGGCFFRHCDSDHLLTFLRRGGHEGCFDDLHNFCQDGSYSNACKSYLHHVLKYHELKGGGGGDKELSRGVDILSRVTEDKISQNLYPPQVENTMMMISMKRKREPVDPVCRCSKNQDNMDSIEKSDHQKSITVSASIKSSCNRTYSVSNKKDCLSGDNSSDISIENLGNLICDSVDVSDTSENNNFHASLAKADSHNVKYSCCSETGQNMDNQDICSSSKNVQSRADDQQSEDTDKLLRLCHICSELDRNTCNCVYNRDQNAVQEDFVSHNVCDPELCPSQCEQKQKLNKINSEIIKPADFYFSLRKLVQGLSKSK